MPPLTNPADFWLDSITPDFRSDDLREVSIRRIQMLQDKWGERLSDGSPPAVKLLQDAPAPRMDQCQGSFSNSVPSELMILLERDFAQEITRNKVAVIATLGQCFFQVIMFGFIFWQLDFQVTGIANRIGYLFIIVINQSFGVVMPIIGRFPADKALIRRERSAGTYRAETAFLSKVTTSLIQPLASAAISSCILYWMVGLQIDASRFFTYLGVVCLHVVGASFIGLAIGAAVPTSFVGQTIAPLLMLVMVLYSGQLVNVTSISPIIRWIKFVSLLRYTYSSLIQNELRGLKFDCHPPGCFPTGEEVLSQYNLDEYPISSNCIAVAGISVAVFFIGYALFRWKTKPSLKLR
eukprot:CRZ02964.1 hypothetical protein [Spongospora subterranea]